MNYVIAVLSDRIQAEAAYSALEKENFPVDKVSIVGAGYKDASEFSFIDPQKKQRTIAQLMSFWLVPFGFIGGYAFNISTGFQLLDGVGAIGNHLLGGVFGAVAGLMGSVLIGSGWLSGNTDNLPDNSKALPYRNWLKAGKYLIVVNAPANLTNQATRILRQFEPENIQRYVAPGKA
jgi:hypothetical protein